MSFLTHAICKCGLRHINQMKIIIKILTTLVLLYAFFIKLVDNLFSILSISPDTQMDILISEKMIPDFISLLAMGYCFYCLYYKKR